MPRYLGAEQLGECQRCGLKTLARMLIPDGRNKQLLVCNDSGCYDPPHESERPYIPRNNEGKAKYPIAPENLPAVAGELEGLLDSSPLAWEDSPLAWEDDPLAWLVGAWSTGGGVTLTWDRMEPVGARVERYEIFRSVDGAAFALLATNAIEYSFIMEIENTPEIYVDAALTANVTIQYYIEGVTANGKRYRTNTLSVDVGDLV